MEKKVTNLGTGGLNVDTPSHQLPPNVFSDGLNLRFTPENKIRGSHSFKTATGYTVVDMLPRTMASYQLPGSDDFQLVTLNGGSATSRITVADSSGGDIRPANSASGFNLGFLPKFKPQITTFNNLIVVNTGTSIPQYVVLNEEGKLKAELADFDNWEDDVGANITSRLMRAWDDQLVFLVFDNDKGTSSPTDDTTEPVSLLVSGIEGVNRTGTLTNQRFTVATTFVGADDFILTGTPGKIVDGLQLRDSFMVYKSNSWIKIDRQVTQTGVFYSSQILSTGDGLLTSDCVVEFENALHFVVGNNGIYIHNGSEERQNISKGIMEDAFYNELKNPDRTFVHHWTSEKEIWICYSDGATDVGLGTGVNKAWCYNYEIKTWYKRTLPNLYDMVEVTLNAVTRTFAIDGTNKFIEMDLFNYEATAFLEKRNADMGDASMTKKIIRLFPQADMDATSQLSISVAGHQGVLDGPLRSVLESKANTFDPMNDYKIDLRETGRYIDLLVEGKDPQLSALGVEVLPGSRR